MKVKQINKPNQKILSLLKSNYLKNNPLGKTLSYDQLAIELSNKYDLDIDGRDLWLLDEPTLEEEILDLELMYKNLGL